MKTRLASLLATAMLLLSTFILQPSTGLAQGTAFSYQGRLETNGLPVTGSFDLRFALFDISGPQVGPTVTNLSVGVSNGLFTTAVDFGSPLFEERDQFLEIAVRPAASAAPFETLSPRQFLAPAPKASFAYGAGQALTLTGNPLIPGVPTFGASGSPPFSVNSDLTVSNLSADLLDGLDAGAFWQVGGNAGTVPGTHFLGTTDHQPLELRVNHLPALRLTPTLSNDTVNVVLGSSLNFIGPDVIAVTIAGGGTPVMFGAPASNSVRSDFATISGGIDNQIGFGSPSAIIGGGFRHRLGDGSADATIGGGANNTVRSNSWRATIAGGLLNEAGAPEATVSGGSFNRALAYASAIGGGGGNRVSGEWSTIAGGRDNVLTNAHYATIGGGRLNTIGTNAWESVIAGGWANLIEADAAEATIGGGWENRIGSASLGATIPGGISNAVTAPKGFAAGYRARASHTGSFVWADSTEEDFSSSYRDQFLIRAYGGVGINTETPLYSLDVNGSMRAMSIVAGSLDTYGLSQSGDHVFSGNLRQMITLGAAGFFTSGPGIGLQTNNVYFRSDSDFSWYRGGFHSDTPHDSGGFLSVEMMRLGGGYLQVAGNGNEQAYLGGDGAGGDIEIGSRNAGIMNVGFWNSAAFSHMNVFALSFTPTSDRNAKENFKPVDAQSVLDKVAALPLSEWNYKADAGTRHLGPMAQDFYAAFGVGPDDKHIATVDADGVALAAIQGLHQKMEKENAALRAENAELRKQLQEIRQLISNLTQ